jgi:sarcosine oxidase delta subunit
MIGLALTPEQFKILLRMVYMANTVANAHRDEGFLQEYDDLEQYIFSRAKEAGFPAATWRHKIGGEEHHHPSLVFENDTEVNELMDAYDLEVTLLVLAEQFALKEIEGTYGENAKESMPEKDYEELLEETAMRYEKILSRDGFKNITIEDKVGESK